MKYLLIIFLSLFISFSSAHIWLYYIIFHENPELRTPELEDWIYNMKMPYGAMGVPLGSPLKDDVY